MITPELLDFIKAKLAQGAPQAEIKTELLGAGWAEPDIDEGFKTLNTPQLTGVTGAGSTVTTGLKTKIIGAIIIVVIAIAGIGTFYYLFKKPSVKPGVNLPQQQQTQPQSNPSSGGLPIPQSSTGSSGASQNFSSPSDTYLAYKKDLYTKTETGAEIVALFRKYRPALIVKQWDQQGGADKVFPTTIASCSLLKSLRVTNPDNTIVRVDSQTQTNTQNVTLSLSAAGGYKGQVTMILESDGWKVEQESWPTWPVDPIKLVNPPCQ